MSAFAKTLQVCYGYPFCIAMLSLHLTLFIAGLLTILLPCILPLIPIVLGVSIAGRSKWRPLLTIMGMVVSFVGFTFLLFVLLDQFVILADYLRIGTYFVLLLFGLGFVTHHRIVHVIGAILGALFFLSHGWIAVSVAALLGILAMEIGGRIATKIQQLGTDVQQKTQQELGRDNPFTAFIIGLTLGLVWVPCAGPALGFAFALVRDEPGLQALLALFSYGLGTAVPLLLIGYGGQAAVQSVRRLSRYSGVIKQVAGVLLVLTAIGLHFRWFERAQIILLERTNFGDLGTRIEERLFQRDMFETMDETTPEGDALPDLGPAPTFAGLGPWHNSDPLTMEELRGKVVLVDFWTYSCINCIRTLPYLRGYWESYRDQPFVLIGIHTPEFVFEKAENNVADAIDRHDLTYPVAQDNDYATWDAFRNRYWPAKYLIDAEGRIRYTHFGEGDYEETERAIRSLLAEAGYDVTDMPMTEEETRRRRALSPETYLGARSWDALSNAQGDPSDAVIAYEAPDTLSRNAYALDGDWQLIDRERQVLRSETGSIRMRFLGGEINLVLGLSEDAAPVDATVFIDGEQVHTFAVDHNDLFPLWKGDYGTHDLELRFSSPGVSAYAFTFGG